LVLFSLVACNTFQAAKGNTSGGKVMGGVKQDAKVAGDTIEKAAHEVGDALGKALNK